MEPSKELTRLIAMAIVDPKFCRQLLDDPVSAGVDFDLADVERQALASIRAGSLAELAGELIERVQILHMGHFVSHEK